MSINPYESFVSQQVWEVRGGGDSASLGIGNWICKRGWFWSILLSILSPGCTQNASSSFRAEGGLPRVGLGGVIGVQADEELF